MSTREEGGGGGMRGEGSGGKDKGEWWETQRGVRVVERSKQPGKQTDE